MSNNKKSKKVKTLKEMTPEEKYQYEYDKWFDLYLNLKIYRLCKDSERDARKRKQQEVQERRQKFREKIYQTKQSEDE